MSARTPYPTPSPALRTARNDMTHERLVYEFDLLLSYATAWRGEGWLLGEYIRQLRAGTIQIIQRHKKLDLVQSEKDWRTRCADKQGAMIAESGAPR
jgi:hypothetical protein